MSTEVIITVECAQCGVKATCPEDAQPAYWIGLTLDPVVLCCSRDCLDRWKQAHRNVLEAWTARWLEQFKPVPAQIERQWPLL